MPTTGQCKVDPVAGVSGDIFTAWTADTDAALRAEALVSGDPVRAMFGAQIQAVAAAIVAASGASSAFYFRLNPASTAQFGTPRTSSGSAPTLSTTTYHGRPCVRVTANASVTGFVPLAGIDLDGPFVVEMVARWNGVGSGQRMGFAWNANSTAYTWFGVDTPGSGSTNLWDSNLDGTGENFTAFNSVSTDAGVDWARLRVDVALDTANAYDTHTYGDWPGYTNFQQRRFTSLRTTGAGNTRCGIFTAGNTGYLDIAELIVWKPPRLW